MSVMGAIPTTCRPQAEFMSAIDDFCDSRPQRRKRALKMMAPFPMLIARPEIKIDHPFVEVPVSTRNKSDFRRTRSRIDLEFNLRRHRFILITVISQFLSFLSCYRCQELPVLDLWRLFCMYWLILLCVLFYSSHARCPSHMTGGGCNIV